MEGVLNHRDHCTPIAMSFPTVGYYLIIKELNLCTFDTRLYRRYWAIIRIWIIKRLKMVIHW